MAFFAGITYIFIHIFHDYILFSFIDFADDRKYHICFPMKKYYSKR